MGPILVKFKKLRFCCIQSFHF